MVCQHYYPEPFRITDICEELVKRGHQVTALVGLPNYPEGKVLKEYKKKEHRDEVINGVRVIRCHEHGRGHNAFHLVWNYYSYALSAKRKVRKLEKDFDVVFIAQLSPVMMAWPGIKYAKKNKVKTLLYCYDLWPASLSAGGIKKNSLVYKHFKKVSNKVYSSVDHICVTSKSFIDYFKEEHNIDEKKISYLPPYCEDIYQNIETIPHEGFNFVFAGNIGKMQSVETIIKAANHLKDRKDIKIHIVGDGRDFDNCKKLAEELKTDNVIFYGRRPIEEMPKFYSMADAMLVTLAKDELVTKTLPGKVQSYMMAGKPIIGAADGETQIVINDAKCGYCVNSEDYEGLSKAILGYIENQEKEIMKNNASIYSQNNFAKEHFTSSLLKIFSSLVQ